MAKRAEATRSRTARRRAANSFEYSPCFSRLLLPSGAPRRLPVRLPN
jgi:hypothetical protein